MMDVPTPQVHDDGPIAQLEAYFETVSWRFPLEFDSKFVLFYSIGFCFQHVVFNMPSKVVSMKNLGEHIIAAFPPADGRLAEAGWLFTKKIFVLQICWNTFPCRSSRRWFLLLREPTPLLSQPRLMRAFGWDWKALTTVQRARMDVGGLQKKTNKKPSDVLDICFRFDLNFGFQVHFSFMFCKSFGFIFYPADFPPNTQFKVHWREFLREGYKPHYGALMVKFPDWSRDGSRAIQQGSVGLVDGQTKLLIMLSIVSFVAELELSEADCEHPILKATLASFASIYCSFTHYDHPGHYFLQSLRCLTSDWVSNSIFVFCDVCFFALLCFSTNLSQFLAHCHI